MIVINTPELVSHGNVDGRTAVLDILQVALRAPDPYVNARRLVRIEGNRLIVGQPDLVELAPQEPLVFDLNEVGHIYVIGGGKAVQRIAQALEEVLGDRITDGQINVKKGDRILLRRIPVTPAGHPLPDEDSVAGAKRIIEIAQRARKGDIVFSLDSGGGTATTALPVPGVSLADLQEVYRILYFECGANMPAANAVRNHLAIVNTKHARYVRDATLIRIHSSEWPRKIRPHLYEQPKNLTGHEAAIQVLHAYHCWDRVPASVREFLLRADPQYGPIRPEELTNKPVYQYRVVGPEQMVTAAQKRAEELGIKVLVLGLSLNDIETRPVAEMLSHLAHEAEVLGLPVRPPCMFLCGGELVVATGNSTGRGGRNMEFALASVPWIAGSKRIVVASVDSEGTDGPTEAAGGIADGYTLARMAEAGLDLQQELENHNSYGVLHALGDTIITGVRGMNVRDLRIVYVGA